MIFFLSFVRFLLLSFIGLINIIFRFIFDDFNNFINKYCNKCNACLNFRFCEYMFFVLNEMRVFIVFLEKLLYFFRSFVFVWNLEFLKNYLCNIVVDASRFINIQKEQIKLWKRNMVGAYESPFAIFQPLMVL